MCRFAAAKIDTFFQPQNKTTQFCYIEIAIRALYLTSFPHSKNKVKAGHPPLKSHFIPRLISFKKNRPYQKFIIIFVS